MYFVPGTIGTLMMVMVMTLTAFAIVREREIGTLEQIMVTPIRPIELILGKTIPYMMIALTELLIVSLVGVFWFAVPLRGSILILLAGSLLFIAGVLGTGLFISTISSTQQQAMVVSFFFIQPAITLSGFGFPITSMPVVLQWVTFADPLRYYLVVAAWNLSQGYRHGRAMAAISGHGRLRDNYARRQRDALPQDAGLASPPLAHAHGSDFTGPPA